jgi:hypothetical protein
MSEPVLMGHAEYCEHVLSVLEEHVYPYMKKGMNPFDSISSMMHQIGSEQGGIAMRIPLLVTMLRSEARLPRGMSLTGKAAGGSPTASVKREFGLRTGLSKQRTYEVFATMAEVASHMVLNKTDVYELHDYSEHHIWCDESNDGTMLFIWPFSWGEEDE